MRRCFIKKSRLRTTYVDEDGDDANDDDDDGDNDDNNDKTDDDDDDDDGIGLDGVSLKGAA